MFAGLRRDRQGIASLAFAALGTVVLAFIGFALEVGYWYHVQSSLQAAADLAARAGVAALMAGGDTGLATAQAQAVMSANGFTIEGANVTFPDAYGPASVAVQATTTVTPMIAAAFIGAGAFNVSVQSIATSRQTATACVLATATEPNQNLVITATQLDEYYHEVSNCLYASNSAAADAINVVNGQSFLYGLWTSGDCTGNCNNDTGVKRPLSVLEPPIVDPYATSLQGALQGPLDALTAPGQAVCVTPKVDGSVTYLVPAAGVPAGQPGSDLYPQVSGPDYYMYCNGDVTLTGNANVALSPGVYIFYNATLTVQNQASLTCTSQGGLCENFLGAWAGPGVAFVFTGTPGAGAPTASANCSGAPVGWTNPWQNVVVNTSPNVGNDSHITTQSPVTLPSLTTCTSGHVQLTPPGLNHDPMAGTGLAGVFYPAANPGLTTCGSPPCYGGLWGALVWRDGRLASGAAALPAADIQAAPQTVIADSSSLAGVNYMNGVMYFPNAFVNFGANDAHLIADSVKDSSGNPTQWVYSCSELVAGSVNLVGNPSVFFDCSFLAGTQIPWPRASQPFSVR